MEVKLFVAENPQLAESQVNEWLQHHAARVHHVAQSQSEKNGRFVFVISIYYTNNNSSAGKMPNAPVVPLLHTS